MPEFRRLANRLTLGESQINTTGLGKALVDATGQAAQLFILLR